jgi:hypothetical protein
MIHEAQEFSKPKLKRLTREALLEWFNQSERLASTIRLCLAGHGVVFDLAVKVETYLAALFSIGMGDCTGLASGLPWRRVCLRMSLMQRFIPAACLARGRYHVIARRQDRMDRGH